MNKFGQVLVAVLAGAGIAKGVELTIKKFKKEDTTDEIQEESNLE